MRRYFFQLTTAPLQNAVRSFFPSISCKMMSVCIRRNRLKNVQSVNRVSLSRREVRIYQKTAGTKKENMIGINYEKSFELTMAVVDSTSPYQTQLVSSCRTEQRRKGQAGRRRGGKILFCKNVSLALNGFLASFTSMVLKMEVEELNKCGNAEK